MRGVDIWKIDDTRRQWRRGQVAGEVGDMRERGERCVQLLCPNQNESYVLARG
jgi:hypothetical protein